MQSMKKCLVTPKKYRYITGILPKGKKIEGPMELTLNKKEIKRCMMNGAVVQILIDGTYLPLDEKNWYTENRTELPDIPLDKIAKVGQAKIGQAIIYPI